MKPFLPILLIVISIGIFYLYINPNYTNIRTLLSQRSDYQTALANIEQVKQLRDSLETQYSNISPDDINRLNKVIPQNLNVVKLTADLDSMASKHAMSLRNVRVTEEASDSSTGITTKDSNPYKTTTMSFSVLGTYPSFVSFISDMEKSLQLIDVRTVDMKIASTQGNIMQFDLTIQTYWIQ
jgi:Tfp pilus assembly protein PilO